LSGDWPQSHGLPRHTCFRQAQVMVWNAACWRRSKG
jgi:hypothetical protein